MKTQLKVVALSVLVATSTYAQENKDMYFGLGVVQTKLGSASTSLSTSTGITDSEVSETYKKNNYKVIFGKRLNKNFAVEGSYTDYSSDAMEISSLSAANGAALETAMSALPGYKSLIGLTGTTLTGTGTTNAKITSSAILSSGRNIDLSGLYYFAQSDSFEPFVKLGVSAWNLKSESSAFQYDNTSTGVLTPIAGATAFSNKVSGTDVIYGVGVDGKINDTIKYRVDFERIKADGDIDSIGISMLYNF